MFGKLRFQHVRTFLCSETGATTVEYAVVLSLIAAAISASVLQLSNATADSFDNSAAQLAGAMGS